MSRRNIEAIMRRVEQRRRKEQAEQDAADDYWRRVDLINAAIREGTSARVWDDDDEVVDKGRKWGGRLVDGSFETGKRR